MKKDRDKFLNPEEFKKFLSAAKKYPTWWYWFFRTQAMIGARIGEMVLLRGRDLDLKKSMVCVPTLKRRQTKSVVIREDHLGRKFSVEEVWVSIEDKELINYWRIRNIPPDKLVYPTAKRNAQNAFKSICKSAGLEVAYSSHALRHLFGLVVYQTTKDLVLTSRKLRHKGLSTAPVYIHFDEMDSKKVSKAVSKKLLGG